MLQNELIICFSETEWDSGMTGRQHITLQLGKHNDVVYVNPPAALRSNERRAGQRVLRMTEKLISKRVKLFEFPRILGRSYRPALERILLNLRLRVLRNLCERDRRTPIILAFHPDTIKYAQALKSAGILFHVYDNYAGYGVSKRGSSSEKKLSEISDVVFAVTNELAERHRKWNDNVSVIPNGSDFDLFSNLTEEMPHELLGVDLPKICLVGRLTVNIDFQILSNIAACGDWMLVVVGGMRPIPETDQREAEKVLTNGNVLWVGEVTPEKAAHILSHCDVCICPYRINQITRFGSPLKIYEYLSAGKPVVATKIPALEEVEADILFASDPVEWQCALRSAIASDSYDRQQSRRLIAKQNSWAVRCEQMSMIARNNLATRKK